MQFTDVRLADDGTLFATIRNEVDGAVLSAEDRAFQWNDATWTRTPAGNAMPVDNDGQAVGVDVAAVDTVHAAAFNGVYGIRFPPAMSDLSDPNYLNNETEFTRGPHVIALGIGTATGIRRSTVVGFQAGLNAVEHSCRNPRRTYAVEWLDGAPERLLGNGISYDVNVHDEVVGDDEMMVRHHWPAGAMESWAWNDPGQTTGICLRDRRRRHDRRRNR